MTVRSMEAPRDFQWVEASGALVLAREEAVGWVRAVLERGGTLYEAASAQAQRLQLEGRRPLFVIQSQASGRGGQGASARRGDSPQGAHGREPDPSMTGRGEHPEPERWVVRHYARGGPPVPRLLGDRFFRLGSIRPFHELEASEEARARGIHTPRIVAAAMYPRGPFYRADLVTVFVPGAADLVASLFHDTRKGAGGAMERRDALQAAGELIRQLASRGLLHRDLHAGNILLEWRGAAPSPLLVDLDRCQVMPDGTEASPFPMYRRLRRSLRKWERRTGIRISEGEWEALERAVAR
jgi:3-deoxy-D-manno-octulosonic acid kinase